MITIRVDDRDIASCTAEQILEQAQLDDGMLCWERHWDDHALDKEALKKAQALASQSVDYLDPRNEALQGLAASQLSEGLLHLAIKNILASAGSLSLPAYNDSEQLTLPDGETIRDRFGLSFGNVRISDVRLEQRVGGMVPDVLCVAMTQAGEFPLLIEVVVTHGVDEAKLSKI